MAVGRFYQYSPNDYKSVFAPFPTKELGDAIAAKTDMAMKSYDYGDALPAMINDKVKAYSKQDIETKNNTITDYSNRVAAIFQKNANDPAMSIFELRALSTDINRNLATGKLSNINKNAPQFETYFKDYEQKKNDYSKIIGSDPNVLITENSTALNHDSNANGAYTPYTPQLLTNPFSPTDMVLNLVAKLPPRISESNPVEVKMPNGDVIYKITKRTGNRLFDDKGKDVTFQYFGNSLMGFPEVQRAIKTLGVRPEEYLSHAINTGMGMIYDNNIDNTFMNGTHPLDIARKIKDLQPETVDRGETYIEFLNKGSDLTSASTMESFFDGKSYNPSYFSKDSWDKDGNFSVLLHEPRSSRDGIMIPLTKKQEEENKERREYSQEFNKKLKDIYENSPQIQHRLGGKFNGRGVHDIVKQAIETTANPFNLEYTISNMDIPHYTQQVLGHGKLDKNGRVPLDDLAGKTVVPLNGDNMYTSQTVNNDLVKLKGSTDSIIVDFSYKEPDGTIKNEQNVPVVLAENGIKYAIVDTKLNYIKKSQIIDNFAKAKKTMGKAIMNPIEKTRDPETNIVKSKEMGFVSYINIDENNNPTVNTVSLDRIEGTGNLPGAVPTGNKIIINNEKYDIYKVNIPVDIEGNIEEKSIAVSPNGVRYMLDDPSIMIKNELDNATSNIKKTKN